MPATDDQTKTLRLKRIPRGYPNDEISFAFRLPDGRYLKLRQGNKEGEPRDPRLETHFRSADRKLLGRLLKAADQWPLEIVTDEDQEDTEEMQLRREAGDTMIPEEDQVLEGHSEVLTDADEETINEETERANELRADLQDNTVAELRDMAEELGLIKSGAKGVLIERIVQHKQESGAL